jgi:hypothetical protein
MGLTTRRLAVAVLTVATLAGLSMDARAQELEPRRWSNVPVGLNFVAFAYSYSTGNILLDTTLPIEDLQADISGAALRYVRTLDLGGVSATVDATVPFTSADFSAIVDGVFTTATRDGFGDPRVRLAVNFLGAPALGVSEFASFEQKTVVGASLQVVIPLGDNRTSRLINIGSNRWQLRPQFGFSHSFGHWTVDATLTAWLFQDNDEFYQDTTLEQDPLFAFQAHLLYRFKPGLWLAFDAGVADGGTSTVDGEFQSEIDTNSRYGLTLAVPVKRRHGVSIAFTTGLTTRLGADFDTYVVAYQYMWGSGL